MDIALDACTIINLINGNVIQKIAQIPGIQLFVGDTLLDQEILNPSQNIILEMLILEKKIQTLESSLTISEFLVLKKKFDLGDGETETIVLCEKHYCYMASDDKKARKCGAEYLGQDRIVGSLFLLHKAVKTSLLSVDEAMETVELMKKKGGFLPFVDREYFINEV